MFWIERFSGPDQPRSEPETVKIKRPDASAIHHGGGSRHGHQGIRVNTYFMDPEKTMNMEIDQTRRYDMA